MNASSPSPAPIEKFDLAHTCRKCNRICLDKEHWVDAASLDIDLSRASLSHGICPSCIRQEHPDVNTQFFRKVDGEMVILDATDLVHA